MRDGENIKKATSWWVIGILIIAAGIFAWYITFIGRGIHLIYDEASRVEQSAILQPKKFDLGGDTPLYLSMPSLYAANQTWMYVTKSSPLDSAYQPVNLVPITLPQGDKGTQMLIRQDVVDNLKNLFITGSTEGYDLMVSSAYRSISDQQKLFDTMTQTRGQSYAGQYVLMPGASEHHTGLAIDITDASKECEKDSDECMLSPSTAAWIEESAPKFGFIVRYPSGKETITGISHEPWHLRYVGVVLATQLTENDMTLDEFIELTAPGRFR